MKKILILISLLFFLSSCAFVKTRVLPAKCLYKIQNIDFSTFTLFSILVKINLQIINIHDTDAIIEKLNLNLFINDIKAANIKSDGVVIKAKDRGTIALMCVIPYKSIKNSITNVIKKDAHIVISGHVYLQNNIKLPVTLYDNYKKKLDH